MKPSGYLTICLFLTLLVAELPAMAQQAAPKTQAEYNDYKAAYDEKDPAKKADLAEKYVKAYAESNPAMLPSAYSLMITGYANSKNWAKVMDAADRAAGLPNADNRTKAFAYANAMAAAQNQNNLDKVIQYGDKVLGIEPNDLQTLLTLSTVIPAKYPNDKTQLDKATEMASKALAGVQQLIAKATPEQKPKFVQIDGTLHQTLGLIAYNKQDIPKSMQENEMAIKDNMKDGAAHLYMAYDYINLMAQASQEHRRRSQQSTMRRLLRQVSQPLMSLVGAKRPSFEDDIRKYRNTVIDELAIAVAINGPYAVQAKRELTKQWTTRNKSAAGLDEFVNQKKTQIGG
jgi:hypothetical protein